MLYPLKAIAIGTINGVGGSIIHVDPKGRDPRARNPEVKYIEDAVRLIQDGYCEAEGDWYEEMGSPILGKPDYLLDAAAAQSIGVARIAEEADKAGVPTGLETRATTGHWPPARLRGTEGGGPRVVEKPRFFDNGDDFENDRVLIPGDRRVRPDVPMLLGRSEGGAPATSTSDPQTVGDDVDADTGGNDDAGGNDEAADDSVGGESGGEDAGGAGSETGDGHEGTDQGSESGGEDAGGDDVAAAGDEDGADVAEDPTAAPASSRRRGATTVRNGRVNRDG
jgi:hypothetical protein